MIVLVEWPTKEAATAFYSDAEYAPHLKARLEGAVNEAFLVEGKDDFAP